MSERIRADFRKWQEEARKKIGEIDKAGKSSLRKLSKDAEGIEAEGIKLTERLREEAGKSSGEVRKSIDKMAADARKTVDDLRKARKKSSETHTT